MRLLFLFIFIVVSCSFSSRPGVVQEQVARKDIAPTPLNFDRERLSDLRKQPAFDYTEKISGESWWTSLKRFLGLKWDQLMERLFGDFEAQGILLYFLEILPYLIIVGVLIFAIWLFNRLNPASILLKEPEQNKMFFSEEEEIVQSRDISSLISNALEEGNFRMAIRYQYLMMLRQLDRKGHISYESAKTNADYLREIRQENFQDQFRHLTWIYDFTWYGSFAAEKEDYSKAEREFSRMQELMERSNE